MAYNKVIYGGDTLIDLTSDTVTSAAHILDGHIGHLADGTQVVGTAPDISLEGLDLDVSGMNVIYEGHNLEFNGSTDYVQVDYALFSEENINKDFKIILNNVYQDNTVGTGSNQNERCLMGAMYEVQPWPGLVLRVTSNAGGGVIGIANQYTYPYVTIYRTDGVISVSGLHLGTYWIKLGSTANCTTTHDTPITFGCELNSSGTPYRFTKGAIGKAIIAVSE